jgi:SAM-dependent methyltransferase
LSIFYEKMDNTDFELFYDEQPDYAAFRNDPGRKEDYNIAVDWKARKLINLVPDDFKVSNILEVGCAFGVLLNILADRLQIKSRTGIDISGKNIEVARILYPECIFIQGTIDECAEALVSGLLNRRYDLIILSDIIEHIPDDKAFMKRISEMCSFVLLNLPLEKCFSNRNRQYGGNDPSGHLRSYDKDLAIQLVCNTGFEIVTSFTSIAVTDKQFYKMYKKNRTERVNSKPLPLRLFWSLFYSAEDKIKLMNKGFTEKIYGTNYFALLRSISIDEVSR